MTVREVIAMLERMDPLDPVHALHGDSGEKCGPLHGADECWTRARRRRAGQTGGVRDLLFSGDAKDWADVCASIDGGRTADDAPDGVLLW